MHRTSPHGQNPQTQSQGHPGLLRPPPHQQRPHRSHQRTPRTPPRHRTRIHQPPKLPPTLPPPLRRIPTPPTPSNAKSRFACAGLLVSSVVPLCTDQSCPPVTNVARNSPPHISDFEIRPLELQRLWTISKNDRVELRAKLIWRSPRFPRGHRGLARAHRRSLHRWRWGFCTIRSLPSACRRRVAPLMVQFPPFGGGEVAT